MPNGISFSDVETWLEELPELVFHEVEQVADPEAQFNFVVKSSGLTINIVQPENGGPLMIGTNLTLDGPMLDAVHQQRERFFAEIGSVLTNAPGIYSYADADGNDVPSEEFTTVVLRHWIYPNQLSQGKLTTDIIDILNAATYVRDTAGRIEDNPGLLGGDHR